MLTILIISSVVAVGVSFLCSLAETLLLSLNPLTLNRLQASRPRSAEAWRRLKNNVARPITAILVLNTVAHTGGATVAGGAFAQLYGEHNIWIFSVLFTLVILLGTEILPKILGVTFRNQLAPAAGPLLEILTRVMHPFIKVSELMFSRLTSKAESEQITTADLITLATLARSGKVINLDQENIIVNAVRLSHTRIDCAMIPLERVHYIRRGDTAEAVLALARESGHTRYPVSRSGEARDIDAFIQINRAFPSSAEDLERLLAHPQPIHTVNLHDTIMTALQVMLQFKVHLVAVVDDRKRCAGIVTMEDIAGELLSADIEQFK